MKTAVIGIGNIAQVHIPALLGAKQDIVALCDVDSARCEKAIERFGLQARVYTDYAEMLEKEELDAVHVCTPHYLHAEMICACLDKNVNVLTEKPLAISQTQLDTIEAAVKKSTAQLGVCHQRRYEEAMKYLKEKFSSDPVIAAYGNMCWYRGKDYYDSDAWRGTWTQEGGGVMINQALHTLDLLQWISGMPTSVVAHTHNDTLQDVIEVEDTATGNFTLANGGKMILNATNGCTSSFPVGLMLDGKSSRALVVGDHVIVDDVVLKKDDELPLFGKEEWGVGHQKLIADYYRCLANGEKFPIDFYEGEKVIRLILAMYQSNGKQIEI